MRRYGSRARSARRCRARWAARSASTCCGSSSTTSAASSARPWTRRREADGFREKIAAAGMPEEAEAQALRELDRLEQTPPAAAEHGVIRSYLEWMTDLPWDAFSEDHLSVDRCPRRARRGPLGPREGEGPHRRVHRGAVAEEATCGVRSCASSARPVRARRPSASSIARALGRRFERISLGGVRDEAEIRGHRRTYVGALPGRIIQGLRRAGTRNPVFMLDEIDKVGADYRGDPSSALLEVLDPEQNGTFSDHYLEVPFDLSQVLFIATANVARPDPSRAPRPHGGDRAPRATPRRTSSRSPGATCCRASGARTASPRWT